MEAARPVTIAMAVLTLAGCFGEPEQIGPGGSLATACGLSFEPGILLGDVGPGGTATEPAIAFGPGGEIAVASIWNPLANKPLHDGGGYAAAVTNLAVGQSFEAAGQNAVWLSPDGQTFSALHGPTGRLSMEGHQGNQDADLTFSASGALHVALYGPNGIEVLTSRDSGSSWEPSGIVSPPSVDRQWILADGERLMVSWRGLATIANLQPNPADVGFATSDDDGQTWTQDMVIVDSGFAIGPLAAHDGLVIAPIDIETAASSLAVTGDFGATWDFQSTVDTGGAPGFVVPLSRADGTVMMVWTVEAEPARIDYSEGLLGGAWSPPLTLSAPNRQATFPWPVERPDGSVAVFFYEADGPGDAASGERDWYLGYALRCAGAREWQYGLVQHEPVHHGAMCLDSGQCSPVPDRTANDRSVGEIFEAGVAPNGRVWVTWTATTDDEIRSNQIWIAGEAA